MYKYVVYSTDIDNQLDQFSIELHLFTICTLNCFYLHDILYTYILLPAIFSLLHDLDFVLPVAPLSLVGGSTHISGRVEVQYYGV